MSAVSAPYMQMADAQGAVAGHQPAHFNGVYQVVNGGTATSGLLMRREEGEKLAFRRFINIKEGEIHAGASFTNRRGIPMTAGPGYDASDKNAFNVYDRLIGDPRADGRVREAVVIYPSNTAANQAGFKEGDLVSIYRTADMAASMDRAGISTPLLSIGADTAFSAAPARNGLIRDSLIRMLSHYAPERESHMVFSSDNEGLPAVHPYAQPSIAHRMSSLVTPQKATGLPSRAKHRVWGKDPTGDDDTPLSLRQIMPNDQVRAYSGTTKTMAISNGRTRGVGTGVFDDRKAFVSAVTSLTTNRIGVPPFAVRLALYKGSSLV